MGPNQRNWRRLRDYWLDHFGLNAPALTRHSDRSQVSASDYISVPIPVNSPVPLAPPCLIWRWGLTGDGYGVLKGRNVHVVAFEQSRGAKVSEGKQINHLCNRPFCLQPAHLYEGTRQDNAQDFRAVHSEFHTYKTWAQIGNRWDRAMSDYYWEAPDVERPTCAAVIQRSLGMSA